jgi:hypothetical protein
LRCGGELCLDPGTDVFVDLLDERLDNGIPVIGPELVMNFGRGTDLIWGKPGVAHTRSLICAPFACAGCGPASAMPRTRLPAAE